MNETGPSNRKPRRQKPNEINIYVFAVFLFKYFVINIEKTAHPKKCALVGKATYALSNFNSLRM